MKQNNIIGEGKLYQFVTPGEDSIYGFNMFKFCCEVPRFAEIVQKSLRYSDRIDFLRAVFKNSKTLRIGSAFQPGIIIFNEKPCKHMLLEKEILCITSWIKFPGVVANLPFPEIPTRLPLAFIPRLPVPEIPSPTKYSPGTPTKYYPSSPQFGRPVKPSLSSSPFWPKMPPTFSDSTESESEEIALDPTQPKDEFTPMKKLKRELDD